MSLHLPGMDHDLYPFSPLPTRPPLHWPGSASVAFSVILYLECWEMDPPPGALTEPRFKDPFGDFRPDYRTYSWREYGNRVGIFRIVDLLDRYGIKPTVAANAEALERYPFLVEQLLKRGYPFAAHGTLATRMLSSRMNEAEETHYIACCLDAVARATGKRPSGWISQDYGESPRTPALLAEAGITHIVDWPNDEQPYLLSTKPRMVSIPSQPEWDDVQLLWHRRLPTPRFPGLVREAFETLHQDGIEGGRFFGLHIHPWLFGMPHRIGYLGQALNSLTGFRRVWRASLEEVAQHILAPP